MKFDDTSIPPEVICNALKEVVGVDLDPSNEEDRHFAAVVVHKLDPEIMSRLTGHLANQLKAARLISSTLSITPLPFRIVEAVPIGEEDLLSTDHPSDASEASEDDVLSVGITSFVPPEIEPIDNGWTVICKQRAESLPIYSPHFLGFKDEEYEAKWRPNLKVEWGKFLSAAEEKIQNRRFDSWRSVFQKFHHVPPRIFCAEQLAKNYSVVNLKNGPTTSVAHFLFISDTLYLVLVLNEHVKRLTASVTDSDSFTKKILDAFEGDEDNAKDTLVSLRKVLDTYSPDSETSYGKIIS